MRDLILKLWAKATRKPFYLHLLVLVLIAIANFLLYMGLWLKPGFISYGDTNYIMLRGSYFMKFENILNTYNGGSISLRQGFWYTFTYTFFVHLFGGELGHKVFLYILLLLGAFMVYLGFYRLFELYFDVPTSWIIAFISMLISFYSFYNGLLQGLGSTFGVSTLFAPYALYFLRAEKLRRGDPVLLFLLFLLCNAQPITITYSGVLIIVALIYYLLVRKPVSGLKRITFYTVILVLASMYYLLPTYVTYYKLHLYATSIPYSKTIVTYNALKLLSPYTLTDLMFTGQHSRLFFQYHPDTRSPLNAILLVLAALPLIFISKRRDIVVTLYVFLLISIFLSKGINPPLGNVYYRLVQVLPDPAAAFLRNPAKYTMLYMYSLAALASMGVMFLYDCLRSKISRRVAIVIIVTLTVLAFSASFNTLLIKLNYFTYTNFGPHEVPEPYIKLYEYLKNHGSTTFFRVVSYPVGGLYIWTSGDVFPTSYAILSNYPCTLLPVECYPLNKYLSQLTLLDFKYAILHNDTYNIIGKSRGKILYHELESDVEKYSIERKAWCSTINKTYYQVEFEYLVKSSKPLDGFRVEITLSSSNLRKDIWRFRVSMLFMTKFNKTLYKEGNMFIARGTAMFQIPRQLLEVYSKAYLRPVYIYVDPYTGGFKDIIPNPLPLGLYDGKLLLRTKQYYSDNRSGLSIYIKIINIKMKSEALRWCINLYKLNTTPVNLLINGEIVRLPSSALVKGIGDEYRVKITIPPNLLGEVSKKFVVILPFTYDKADMWSIDVKLDGRPVKFNIMNVSNTLALSLPIEQVINNFMWASIRIKIILISKVFLSFLIGLIITSVSLIAIAIVVTMWGRH